MSAKNISGKTLYKLNLIANPRLSPDGKSLVYALTRIDKSNQKKYSNLWVASTESGENHQFTYGNQADTFPCWSPSGDKIAFLSNRENLEKPPQIHIIPFTGGEARQLSSIKGEITKLSWSPDGKTLLFAVRKTDEEVLAREEDEQKKKLGVVSRHYTRVYYKLDGYGYLPKELWHIWTIDVETGKPKQLTDHNFYSEHSPAWAPDGKKIVFISNRSENPDFERDADDIYIMSKSGENWQKIETPIGRKGLPEFSPDGKKLAYFGQESNGQWYKNVSLWTVPINNNQPPENHTHNFDIHVGADTLQDSMGTEQMPPTWSTDGNKIFFQIEKHGSTTLECVDIISGNLEHVAGENASIGSFTFDHNQSNLSYFQVKINNPGQLFIKNLTTNKTRQLTNVNKKIQKRLDKFDVEEVWFKGADGNDLQGWILKPPAFDPNQKYPSILEIHGGPIAQYGNAFMHEFYYLASAGYVVYYCNPRGGRGYGEEHARAIWGDWGNVDYADLMAFTDLISQKPYIDADRMGVTGGSYGGYMTLWIIGHTHRFKAAVAQRVVSNLISLWGASDMNWVFQQIFGDKPPFEDVQVFWDHSPMKFIGNAITPTLIIHSEMDLRCPIEQGEQAYVALKRIGVDSEMVRFPDEPHGLSRTGRSDRKIVRLKHIKRWFDKYL